MDSVHWNGESGSTSNAKLPTVRLAEAMAGHAASAMIRLPAATQLLTHVDQRMTANLHAGADRVAGASNRPLTAAPDRGDERDARPVGQVDVGRRLQQDGVGPRARSEVPDVGPSEGFRAAERG